ncbi:MAG: lamin tail domain-containing protein [Candidatus Pacebacteria bacterium]|nr:lamin tail domain-containing protein [Candidatus Paceibacterota bacterium]
MTNQIRRKSIKMRVRNLGRKKNKIIEKIISGFCLVLAAFALQGCLFASFETHAINVTATVCRHSDIRSVNYWQGHPGIYENLLPVNIGNEIVDTLSRVEIIFGGYDKSPIDNLKSELLALKFNEAYFGIGGYAIPGESKTVNEIIADTDNLFIDPATGSQETDRLVFLLRSLNVARKIKYCANNNLPVPPDDILLINKIYYDIGTKPSPAKTDWQIELYNPGPVDINIKGWILCNRNDCNRITKDGIMAPGSYVFISQSEEIRDKQRLPGDILLIRQIHLAGPPLTLDAINEMLILQNPDAVIVDQINWGFTDSTWSNYNSSLWNPGLPEIGIGHAISRNPAGLDTDQKSDWIDFITPDGNVIDTGEELLPSVEINPVFWNASNNEIIGTTSTLPVPEPVLVPTTKPAPEPDQIKVLDSAQNSSSTGAEPETAMPEDQKSRNQSPFLENKNLPAIENNTTTIAADAVAVPNATSESMPAENQLLSLPGQNVALPEPASTTADKTPLSAACDSSN